MDAILAGITGFLAQMVDGALGMGYGITSASLAAAGAGAFHPAGTDGGKGIAVFARDTESSRQVWSAESGYPGDPRYREFFRDVGLDAPMEALAEYLEGSQIRRFTGLKCHRVTGSGEDKLFYDPALTARGSADRRRSH